MQALYVTPHRWTPYCRQASQRRVVQTRWRWDYRHQVLATRHMPPWRVLMWVKFIEAVFSLRPHALWRLATHDDRPIRLAQRRYYRIGRKVWFYEIWCFLFRERHASDGPSLSEFWGDPQDRESRAMNVSRLVSAKLVAGRRALGGTRAGGLGQNGVSPNGRFSSASRKTGIRPPGGEDG